MNVEIMIELDGLPCAFMTHLDENGRELVQAYINIEVSGCSPQEVGVLLDKKLNKIRDYFRSDRDAVMFFRQRPKLRWIKTEGEEEHSLTKFTAVCRILTYPDFPEELIN